MVRKFENLRNDKRNGAQFAYILDSITHEGTDREKVAALLDEFRAEFDYDYNRRKYPNLAQRVGAWLQGLGGSISVAFADFDIIEQGKAWGYCRNDYEAGRFVADWWNVCGYRCVQLWQAAGLL